MTVTVKPLFIQDGGETAEQARRMLQALFGRTGIVSDGDLAVSEKSTPDMSVDVAAGQIVVAGSEATDQGWYVVYNDATVNLAVADADSTDDRIDVVVVKIADSQYSGDTDAASVAVVTGVAAASPSAPSGDDLPENSLILAEISISANATSITDADITSKIPDGLALTRGPLGVLESTTTAASDTANSTTPVTVTSGTFSTRPGTRLVEVNAQVSVQSTVSSDLCRITVLVDDTEVARLQAVPGGAGSAGATTGSAWGLASVSEGSHTWSVTVLRVTGTGTVTGSLSSLAVADLGAG